MRSVHVYLIDTQFEDIRAVLSSFAHPQESDRWLYPRNTKQVSLCIRLSTDFSELDAHKLAAIEKALGRCPDISVIADVSGPLLAHAEVPAFVEHLLARFRGVANDGVSPHYWTASEIRTSIKIDGQEFFDHQD